MNWMVFGPELCFLFTAGVFLVLGMGRSDPQRNQTLAVVLGAIGLGICLAAATARGDLFADAYRVDLFSQVFKVVLAMGFLLVVVAGGRDRGIEGAHNAECYLLLATSTLAMMLLVSSVHLVPLFIALELSSYSLYILVAMRSGPADGVNAALKYFLTGACASAMMLLGLALVYGATGSADLAGVLQAAARFSADPAMAVGLLLVLCGFFFKLALFPFHSWAPDVYVGAANTVAAYIAAVSKVAAIALLIRFTALAAEMAVLPLVLMLLCVASMTLGNLAALVQQDLKRLLAYSSIAHAGYVLIGLLSLNAAGWSGAAFYALALMIMKFTCFLVVIVVAVDGRNPSVADLAGLHRRAPVLALALMMALFGLAGIPPTVGFTGKLLLFMAAIQKGYLALVIIAMANVVVSLYYYLQVLKAAYLLEPPEGQGRQIPTPGTTVNALAGGLTVVMIAAGIYPAPLIALFQAATRIFG